MSKPNDDEQPGIPGTLMLNQTLEEILHKVEGAVAILVIGLDGFVIDQRVKDPRDISLEAMAAEMAALARQSQSSVTDLSLGSLEEVDLRTENYYVLGQKITHDYFLCLLLAMDGNFGRARFELRKAKVALVEEFAI